jgi:LuxR family maltose regulon positive regulatory protein
MSIIAGTMVLPATEFTTKCMGPRRSVGTISRRTLLDVLHSRIINRVQTITAPAGYGKTTLLADFASEVDTPVCWYYLDSSDQDPGSLLEGILSSISSRFNDFGTRTRARLATCKDAARETQPLVGLLTGEMHSVIPDFFILILEDYHCVESSERAKAVLNLLFERAPENCHVIISTRTSIELPALARLEVQALSANLNAADMAFTAPEIKLLLKENYDLRLSDEETENLCARTEGWIVAILLSTFSLRAVRPSRGALAVSHQEVFSYFSAEIYDKQSQDIQSFLLMTSTLKLMQPDLCQSLLGSNTYLQSVRRLEKMSLFLQCTDYDKACYRYHQLFREYLQRRLLEENPALYSSLHARAASLFEDRKCYHEAVTHFISAGKPAEAARIIKNIGRDFQCAGKWSTVSAWIKSLPESMRMGDPVLVLFYAKSQIYLGNAAEAVRILTGVLTGITADNQWLLKAESLSWRSAAFRLTGHFNEARIDVEAAMEILERNSGPPDILGDAYRRLGTLLIEQSKFRPALKTLKRSLECFSSIFDLSQMAEVHNSLGILYKRLGHLDQAGMHYEQAVQCWQKAANYGALAMTLNNIAYIYRRRGQHVLALNTLEQGLLKATESGSTRIESLLHITRALVLRDLGSYDVAMDACNKGLALAREVLESYYVMSAKACLGEIYRLQGEPDKAETLMREAIAQADEQKQTYDGALFAVQLGIIAYERGQYGTAAETLDHSARKLASIGDKDALAKVYFHLALCAFLAKRYEDTIMHLQKSCLLAQKLGYDDFMAVEGRNAVLLFEYAISKAVEPARMLNIIEKIKKRQQQQPVDAMPNLSILDARVRPDIEVKVLGESGVWVGGQLIGETKWRSQRAKEIFFYLLSNDVCQTRETITAAIWPDMEPAKAISNFHINLYRLRQALPPSLLRQEGGQYSLNPNLSIRFDARDFELLLRQLDSRPASNKALIARLEEAVRLYRGPFMNGITSDWVLSRQRRLENLYLNALMQLARLKSEAGAHAAAVALLERVIETDPYLDEVYCQLMEEYAALHDDVSAARIYRQYTETVGTEMDCLPPERMQDLHRHLVNTRN